jgi:hypothetical protein
MFRVYLGYQERNVRLHPVCPGVGDHEGARPGKSLLDRPGDVGIDRREDQDCRKRRTALSNLESADGRYGDGNLHRGAGPEARRLDASRT